MILLRNSAHNNGIYIYLDRARNLIIKSSSKKSGILNLRNEYKGQNWLLKQENRSLGKDQLNIVDNGNYVKIKTPYYSGSTPMYFKSISENEEFISLAILKYITIWGKYSNELLPIHGDYSVGNIIYGKDGLNIIDWEHFCENCAPWGFDLGNLIFEALFFSLCKNRTLTNKNLISYKRIMHLIPKEGHRSIRIKTIINFIIKNPHLWGESIKKLPILKFNSEQIQYLGSLEESTL